MSRSYFATVRPMQVTPESEITMGVEVFSYSASECDMVDNWKIPTSFSNDELVKSFDANGWLLADGGAFRYVDAAEAHEHKELPGMHITYAVTEIPYRTMF